MEKSQISKWNMYIIFYEILYINELLLFLFLSTTFVSLFLNEISSVWNIFWSVDVGSFRLEFVEKWKIPNLQMEYLHHNVQNFVYISIILILISYYSLFVSLLNASRRFSEKNNCWSIVIGSFRLEFVEMWKNAKFPIIIHKILYMISY